MTLEIPLKEKMETSTKVVVTFTAVAQSTLQITEMLAKFAGREGGTSSLLGERVNKTWQRCKTFNTT